MTEQRVRELLNAGLSPASAAAIAASEAIQEAAIEEGGPGGSSFPLTADVSADGHTISDLPDPVADGDAVPKSYVVPINRLTADVTTDPDTFVGSHVFDLGPRVWSCRATYTLLSKAADGETFGVADGDISGQPLLTTSYDDGVIDAYAPTAGSQEPTANLIDVDDAASGMGVARRYVRVGVKIDTMAFGFSDDTYAGANHPTVTVRIDVEWW